LWLFDDQTGLDHNAGLTDESALTEGDSKAIALIERSAAESFAQRVVGETELLFEHLERSARGRDWRRIGTRFRVYGRFFSQLEDAVEANSPMVRVAGSLDYVWVVLISMAFVGATELIEADDIEHHRAAAQLEKTVGEAILELIKRTPD
jgi:hypothetical protein